MSRFDLVIAGCVLTLAAVALPVTASGREMPPRAISPDAICADAVRNGQRGYDCVEPGATLHYWCTTPRTVCWPIFPPGPIHGTRGGLQVSPNAVAAGQATRATHP